MKTLNELWQARPRMMMFLGIVMAVLVVPLASTLVVSALFAQAVDTVAHTVPVGGNSSVLGLIWATAITGLISNFSTEINHWLAKLYNGAVSKVPFFLKGTVAVVWGAVAGWLNSTLHIVTTGDPGNWGDSGIQVLLGGAFSFAWTLIQHNQAKKVVTTPVPGA